MGKRTRRGVHEPFTFAVVFAFLTALGWVGCSVLLPFDHEGPKYTCGNDICEKGENSENCGSDCGWEDCANSEDDDQDGDVASHDSRLGARMTPHRGLKGSEGDHDEDRGQQYCRQADRTDISPRWGGGHGHGLRVPTGTAPGSRPHS